MEEKIIIESLSDRDAVSTIPGMYIGSVENADVLLREILDNAFDEAYSYGPCQSIIVDNSWNGFHFIADNGRGIPIQMSLDDPGTTMADKAISSLHSGSKFKTTDTSRIGQNGVGASCANFLSSSFVLISKITEQNWSQIGRAHV